MATHSSIPVQRIPGMEEPGRLQSMGSQRVGHDWATSLHFTSSLFYLLFSGCSISPLLLFPCVSIYHLSWRVSRMFFAVSSFSVSCLCSRFMFCDYYEVWKNFSQIKASFFCWLFLTFVDLYGFCPFPLSFCVSIVSNYSFFNVWGHCQFNYLFVFFFFNLYFIIECFKTYSNMELQFYFSIYYHEVLCTFAFLCW